VRYRVTSRYTIAHYDRGGAELALQLTLDPSVPVRVTILYCIFEHDFFIAFGTSATPPTVPGNIV